MKVYNFIAILFIIFVAQFLCSECHKRYRHHHGRKHGHHRKQRKANIGSLRNHEEIEWENLGQAFVGSHLMYRINKIGAASKKSGIARLHESPKKSEKRVKSNAKGKQKSSGERLKESRTQNHRRRNAESTPDRKVPNRDFHNKHEEHKSRSKTRSKKYSLAFIPNANIQTQGQAFPAFQRMALVGTNQGSSLLGGNRLLAADTNSETNAANDNGNYNAMAQLMRKQAGYQTDNSQEALARYQSNNEDNGANQSEDTQSATILQALAAQQKSIAGQQDDQDAMNQGQIAAYQAAQDSEEQNGQDDGAAGQENVSQQGNEQDNGLQQVGSEEAGIQQGNEQEAAIQQNGEQEARLQQETDQEVGLQQGSEQAAGFQQGEQGEALQQGREQEAALQQDSDQGNEVLQGEQVNNMQQGNEQAATYQQNNEQGGAEEKGDDTQQGFDGGNMANLFSNGGQEPDTQSLAKEGQSITSSDAAQLAAAIANANKGLTTNGDGQGSLSRLASNSADVLNFGNDQPGDQGLTSEGTFNMGRVTSPGRVTTSNVNSDASQTEGNQLEGNQGNELPSYNNQMTNSEEGNAASFGDISQLLNDGSNDEHNLLNFGGSISHHHQHYNDGGIGTFDEDTMKIIHMANQQHHSSADRYCAGCPKNAHCIDKVCIINDDEPLAKILKALSGPDNETDDCSGCHHNAKCRKRECICKPGYSGDGVSCRADRCLAGCSKHGKCIRGFCVCDHHHYFNGVECSPYKISHHACPTKCSSNCTAGCPDKCCKPHVKTKVQPTSAPHKTPTAEKVSNFYLKPTHHMNYTSSNKESQHKGIKVQSNQTNQEQLRPTESFTIGGLPAKPIQIGKTPSAVNVSKPQPRPTGDIKPCSAECNPRHCGSACPDHCCRSNIFNPTASRAGHHMDVLKAFADKFCPVSCQKKCTSTCPPICCDSRSLISVLKNAAGGSEVDVTKTEDLFRNAMSWFGMMNFLNMMYNMYGNMYRPGSMQKAELSTPFENHKPTVKGHVPESKPKDLGCPSQCERSCVSSCPTHCCYTSPTTSRSETFQCLASCRSHCTLDCPAKCCTALPQVSQQPPQIVHRIYPFQNFQKPPSPVHTVEQCPSNCTTHCTSPCPARCCSTQPRAPASSSSSLSLVGAKASVSAVFPTTRSKSLQVLQPSVVNLVQTSAIQRAQLRPRPCPPKCPRSCYPSCGHECCSGAEQYKSQQLPQHGQYTVSISCPLECRPYNCLSYCHHECCLRTDYALKHLKSQITNINVKEKASKTTGGNRVRPTKRYSDYHTNNKIIRTSQKKRL